MLPLPLHIDKSTTQLGTRTCMMAGICHFCRGFLAISSTVAYTTLFFLTTALHASARSSLVSIGASCGFRKAQGAVVKLLAVYGINVLTIKLSPGQRTAATIQHYVIAALLPSSSTYIALLDLTYRKIQFSAVGGQCGRYGHL